MSKEKTSKVARKKLIPLRTYLRAYIRVHGLKDEHYPGLAAHAGKQRVATKERWDALYEEY